VVFRLELRFSSPGQLASHLRRYADLGGVLIPERICPQVPDWVELEFVLGRSRAVVRGPVLRRAFLRLA